MSVWDSDSQALDIYKRIYTIGAPFDKLALPNRPDRFLGCDKAVVSEEFASDWDEVATTCKWGNQPIDSEAAAQLAELSSSVTTWRYGLHAVYTVVDEVRRGRFRCKEAYNRQLLDDSVEEFLTLVTPSTQITPKAFQRRYMQKAECTGVRAEDWENVAEAFKHARFLFSNKGEGLKELEHNKYLGGDSKTFVAFCYNDLMIFFGRGKLQQVGLIMAKQNYDYMIGALTRLGNSTQYILRHYSQVDADNALEWISRTVRLAAKAGQKNSNYVCKCFHKVRTIYQMGILESEFDDAVRDERADYHSDGLNDIVNLGSSLELLRKFTPVRAMEVVHIYKWMPPPDFDATTAPNIVKEYHMHTRSSGLDTTANPASRELYKRIQNERKINLASAYKRRHGQWPAGLTVKGSYVTPAEAQNWDANAFVQYNQMGEDVVGQVKDKTIVCASMNKEINGRKQPSDKSYLLWYMQNANNIDTTVDVAALSNGQLGEDNYVRVAYKPEGHKPDSRLFYMAPPRQRTILGEFEGNLANIARYYPGSLMGKDTADKARIVASIMDLNVPVTNIPVTAVTTTYVVTFDLSKFSPKSNPAVTAEYHDFWAKAFGNPKLAALKVIGCTATIIHTTAGINFSYTNKGADLEGFRGKMMTMFHSDLLATACRLARERGFIVGRSDLACFIDDGAVKVAVVGEDEEARRNAAAFLAVMQEVYAAAGQDNNPSKTVVSQVGGEILAQFYYHGLLVPQGIKALMRLAPDYENAAATFAEEVDQLYATCQGAVKDGANWVVAYRMMAEAVVKSIFRWIRQKTVLLQPHHIAMKMITPKSFGGFGVSSLQGLVTNAATNATIEGAGMLNRAARMYPQHSLEIMGIITRQVVKREPVAILRDPMRVRLATPVLVENRLIMEVVRWLENNASEYTAFMAAYRSVKLLDHAKSVAEALLQAGVVSVPLFERAWKCTPLAYVESIVGKFKRSATIISFLGYKIMNKLRKRNMKDLLDVLAI